MLHTKDLGLFRDGIIIDIPTESGSYVKLPTGTKSTQQTLQTHIVETEEGPVTYQEATGSRETHEGDKQSYWYLYTNNPIDSGD